MTETFAALPARLPKYVEPFRQRGRLFWVVAVWITAAIGIAGSLVFAAQSGDVTGAGLALLFALIPLPVVLWAYWWLDRVEPEPFRYKAAAFVWGSVIAVAIALPVEIGMSRAGMNEDWLTGLGAPLAEEFAKGLFLVVILIRTRRIVDGVLDGLIVSGLVAIGFAAMENVGYYAASYFGFGDDVTIAGAQGATATFVVRGLFSPFAHPLFTSAIGIAMGIAASRRSRSVRWLLIVVGYLVSVGLHALWNGSIVVGGGVGFLVAYAVLALLLICLVTLAIVLRVKQLTILRRSLEHVARRGWIHPAEVPYLVSFARRKQARQFAQQYGDVAAKAMRRYQRIATQMAFLHDAVMTGRHKPHGIERTHALLDQMYGLRPWLRFPPSLPLGVR